MAKVNLQSFSSLKMNIQTQNYAFHHDVTSYPGWNTNFYSPLLFEQPVVENDVQVGSGQLTCP